MLPQITGEFRVVADPELRFTPSGMAIANMRVVANSRKKNEAGEWVDDKVCWLTATAFKKHAENMAETFVKGDLAVITGRLETQSYETREGEKRQSFVLLVDTIGPSIAYNYAKVTRTERSGGGSGASQDSGGGQSQPASGGASAPAQDPWQTGSPDEPPF